MGADRRAGVAECGRKSFKTIRLPCINVVNDLDKLS